MKPKLVEESKKKKKRWNEKHDGVKRNEDVNTF